MAVSHFTTSSMLDEMQVLSLVYAIIEIRHDANGTVSWQGNPDDMGFSPHATAFAAMAVPLPLCLILLLYI